MFHPHIAIRKRRDVGYTDLGVMSVMGPAVGVRRCGKVSVHSAARKQITRITTARAVHSELAKSIRLLQSNLVKGFVPVVFYVVVDMPDYLGRSLSVRVIRGVLVKHTEKTFSRQRCVESLLLPVLKQEILFAGPAVRPQSMHFIDLLHVPQCECTVCRFVVDTGPTLIGFAPGRRMARLGSPATP